MARRFLFISGCTDDALSAAASKLGPIGVRALLLSQIGQPSGDWTCPISAKRGKHLLSPRMKCAETKGQRMIAVNGKAFALVPPVSTRIITLEGNKKC